MENPILKLLHQGQADRYLAIVYTVDLENKLAEVIQNFLINDRAKVKDLLENDKFLRSLSSKIQLAYCLGLISENEFHDLKIINKIRNTFAHQGGPLTFENDRVADFCRNLKLPSKLEYLVSSSKGRFLASFFILIDSFEVRLSQSIENHCNKAKELEIEGFKDWMQRLISSR